MRTRRAIELSVGLGLLLGPLVYALTLTPGPTPVCAEPPAPASAEPPAPARCDQPAVIEVEVAPEPEPAPEVEPAPAVEPARAEFLFVSDAGIVLSSEARHEWGTGRLFEPPGEVTYRAAKRADASALPEELWALRGRSYDLYGPDGKLCSARIGELRVVAQYGGWGLGGVLGEDWFDEDPERASPAQIREGLWKRDDLWLVGEIQAQGDCEGALWARDAELPPPTILRRSEAANPISEARRAAFLGSDEYAEAERSYRDAYATVIEDEYEPPGYYPDWEQMIAANPPRVASWLDADGQPRVLELAFGREGDGCGDPLNTRIDKLELVDGETWTEIEEYPPTAIVDVDLDGRWELLHDGSETESAWLRSATVERDAYVDEDPYCPC